MQSHYGLEAYTTFINKETMKLHLGCGNKRINGFINIDIVKSDAVDIVSDLMKLPYKENSIDLIYSSNVLEHFGRNNKMDFFRNTCWIDVLKYWYKLLKVNGELFVSVPNFETVCVEYLENKRILEVMGLTIGGQKNEEDLHGMIFDFKLLSEELELIGFSHIEEYSWKDFEAFKDENYDDFSAAYLPHMDFKNGRHMMLNLKALKL